jgi:hypothetical protein
MRLITLKLARESFEIGFGFMARIESKSCGIY